MAVVVCGGFGVLAGCAADPNDSLAAQQATTTAVLVTVPQSQEEFPANGVVVDVLALDNNFVPAALTVEAGTEVLFTNNGRNDHNIVPPDDLAVSEWGILDAEFVPGATYSHVFTRPGTYTYVCTIHGTATAGMFGTIVVTAP